MHVTTMQCGCRVDCLRYVSEEELLVTAGRDLCVGPPLRSLRSVQLDDAAWDEKEPLRRIMSIDNLPVIVLHHTVQHVNVSPTDDEQSSCISTSVCLNGKRYPATHEKSPLPQCVLQWPPPQSRLLVRAHDGPFAACHRQHLPPTACLQNL